jgi:hypothetical protein
MQKNLLVILRRFANKWWLVYTFSMILLLGLTVFALVKRPTVEATEIIYTPVIWRLISGIWLIFLMISGILYGLKRRSVWRALLLFGATFILVVFGLTTLMLNLVPPDRIGGLQFPGMIGEDGKRIFVLYDEDSARLGDHVYRVAAYSTDIEGWNQRYNLYQCDSLGIRCELVYHFEQRYVNIIDLAKIAQYPPRLQVNDNTLTLFIGGILRYTETVN